MAMYKITLVCFVVFAKGYVDGMKLVFLQYSMPMALYCTATNVFLCCVAVASCILMI